jgi:hypothetical protein
VVRNPERIPKVLDAIREFWDIFKISKNEDIQKRLPTLSTGQEKKTQA